MAPLCDDVCLQVASRLQGAALTTLFNVCGVAGNHRARFMPAVWHGYLKEPNPNSAYLDILYSWTCRLDSVCIASSLAEWLLRKHMSNEPTHPFTGEVYVFTLGTAKWETLSLEFTLLFLGLGGTVVVTTSEHHVQVCCGNDLDLVLMRSQAPSLETLLPLVEVDYMQCALYQGSMVTTPDATAAHRTRTVQTVSHPTTYVSSLMEKAMLLGYTTPFFVPAGSDSMLRVMDTKARWSPWFVLKDGSRAEFTSKNGDRMSLRLELFSVTGRVLDVLENADLLLFTDQYGCVHATNPHAVGTRPGDEFISAPEQVQLVCRNWRSCNGQHTCEVLSLLGKEVR